MKITLYYGDNLDVLHRHIDPDTIDLTAATGSVIVSAFKGRSRRVDAASTIIHGIR
jgi:hypothetical protein